MWIKINGSNIFTFKESNTVHNKDNWGIYAEQSITKYITFLHLVMNLPVWLTLSFTEEIFHYRQHIHVVFFYGKHNIIRDNMSFLASVNVGGIIKSNLYKALGIELHILNVSRSLILTILAWISMEDSSLCELTASSSIYHLPEIYHVSNI